MNWTESTRNQKFPCTPSPLPHHQHSTAFHQCSKFLNNRWTCTSLSPQVHVHYSLSVVHSVGLDKHAMHVLLYRIVSLPRSPLCSTYSLSFPLDPWQTLIFLLFPWFLPFPECCMVGIVQLYGLRALLSLRDTRLTFPHVFLWLGSFFFFKDWLMFHFLGVPVIQLLKDVMIASEFWHLPVKLL